MLLLTCGLLGTLTRLIVPCEAEHVGQVFTKLSSSAEASLCDTGCPIVQTSIKHGSVAGIDDIVLAIVKAFRTVL